MFDPQDGVEESRRKFLKSAGKLAAYTPPAMVLLMQPAKDVFARSGGRPNMSGCNNGVGNGPDCLPPGLEKNGKKFRVKQKELHDTRTKVIWQCQ